MTGFSTADARRALVEGSLSERDVRLPGEPLAQLRMGGLRLVEGPEHVDVVAWDYGMERILVRAHSLEEAVNEVVARWREQPTTARRASREEYVVWVEEMRDRARSLAPELDAGLVVETQLPPGSVIDRFGNLDGFLLFPAGTPMAQRSLPPDVLDPTRVDHGLTLFGVVRAIDVLAVRARPAFGQPGGGVMFRLATESDTVRDLLTRGDLVVLTVGDAP